MWTIKQWAISGVLAAVCGIGGYALGYKQDREVLVEGLMLPDLLEHQYPGVVKPLAAVPADADPAVTFSRAVSKDQYIEWLEHALRDVQIEEQKRGVQAANGAREQLVESMRKADADGPIRPMSKKEKQAILERFLYSMSEVYAGAVASASKATVTTP